MPPKFQLSLDETEFNETPSYALNATGRELALRAFYFNSDGELRHNGRTLSNISLAQLDWAQRERIGRGASGTVFVCRMKDSDERVAVKCIPISSKTKRDEVERELTFLLSEYDTNFIVASYGAVWDTAEEAIAIPMEWMSYSLADVASFNNGLPEDCLRDIFFQALRALRYLHETKRVIHRDIKPSNILINALGHVKIGDFGVSKMVQTLNISSTYVGTMLFMAPERLEQGDYTYSSDVWSLGLSYVAAATGRNPWAPPEELNLFQLLKKISGNEIPELSERYSDESREFVRACLIRDPEQRPSCEELLRLPLFASCVEETARDTTRLLLVQTSRLVSQAALKGNV